MWCGHGGRRPAIGRRPMLAGCATRDEGEKQGRWGTALVGVGLLPAMIEANFFGAWFKCIDLDGNGEVIVLHSWKPDAVIAEEEQDWNVLSVKERSGWNVLSMLRNKTGTSHLLCE
ncbi:hypothetical protein Dimus_031836 [Dionaea muscipula]